VRSALVLALAVTLASAAGPTTEAARRASCDRAASPHGRDSGAGRPSHPYRTVQHLVERLRAGETGCLLGGAFSEDVKIRRGGMPGRPIVLRSGPGTRATLRGSVTVERTASYVTIEQLNIDGADSTPITVRIFGDRVRLVSSDITNRHRTQSCILIGSDDYGIAHATVINRNRVHDCGRTSLDHGIYIANAYGATRITNNFFYDNVFGFGVKLAPDAQQVVVSHNVIDTSGRSGVIFGQNDESSPTASSNNRVRFNIITSSTRYGVDSYFPSIVGTGNTVTSNCVNGNRLGDFGNDGEGYTHVGNRHAVPRYRSRQAHDFRVRARSRCAGMGPLPTQQPPRA
jgi:hypothetical protein